MDAMDSPLVLDQPAPDRLEFARALLTQKPAQDPAWPAIAAAAAFAVAALALAFGVITLPPAGFTPVPVERSGGR
jgi:hypothetical protein